LPPDRDVGRLTRTIDLKAHAQQFTKDYRASLAAGLPDLHHSHVGDAWAAELITSGLVEIICTQEEPCPAHDDWMVEEHDYSFTICVYPDAVRLGGVGIAY
jgi:hypothetical protein